MEMSVFYSRLKELKDQQSSAWLCSITEYKGRIWSTSGIFGFPCGVWEEFEYKGMDKMRTKVMEHVFIYGYVSFALGYYS
jgi:hypothetical protein